MTEIAPRPQHPLIHHGIIPSTTSSRSKTRRQAKRATTALLERAANPPKTNTILEKQRILKKANAKQIHHSREQSKVRRVKGGKNKTHRLTCVLAEAQSEIVRKAATRGAGLASEEGRMGNRKQ